MTLPDVHLAGEAVAAYVDDALSPAARDRAERHLRACPECHAVVEAQREAKVLLAAALDPEPPSGLVARLRDIPMTTDLGGSDIVYAVDGDQLAWARMPVWPEEPGDVRFAGQRSPAAAAVPAGPGATPDGGAGPPVRGRPDLTVVPVDGAGSRPSPAGRRDATERGGRPQSYPSASTPSASTPSASTLSRRRRGRRLAGALAGLAFGVIASAASGGTSGGAGLPAQRGGGPSADSPQLVIDRGAVSGQPLEAGTLHVVVPTERRAAQLTGPSR